MQCINDTERASVDTPIIIQRIVSIDASAKTDKDKTKILLHNYMNKFILIVFIIFLLQ